MKRYFVSFIILLILFHIILQAGEWSAPVELLKPSGVQFRWRFIKYDSISKQNEIEWGFRNTSNSIITFNYLIVSEKNERILGRITIFPHRVKLGGWMLYGKSILNALVDEVQFTIPRSVNDSTK